MREPTTRASGTGDADGPVCAGADIVMPAMVRASGEAATAVIAWTLVFEARYAESGIEEEPMTTSVDPAESVARLMTDASGPEPMVIGVEMARVCEETRYAWAAADEVMAWILVFEARYAEIGTEEEPMTTSVEPAESIARLITDAEGPEPNVIGVEMARV